MNADHIKIILEAALLAAGKPISIDRLSALFETDQQPERIMIRKLLDELRSECAHRGVELIEVAGGFRYQVTQEMAPWIKRLWEERPARYSKALLETLALIAYRQPITRGEIEDIRGVSLSSSILKTLQEREWVRAVGHRDVPGRPALYGTTKTFLETFGLKSLSDMPTLGELREIDAIEQDLFANLEANALPDHSVAPLSSADRLASAEEESDEARTETASDDEAVESMGQNSDDIPVTLINQ